MDIALRAAGIPPPRHGAESSGEIHRVACITADICARCYRIYIGQDFYNAGQRKEVVQAADFIIKEAESCKRTVMQQQLFLETRFRLSLIKPRLYF
jgi:hypothetical protein